MLLESCIAVAVVIRSSNNLLPLRLRLILDILEFINKSIDWCVEK